MSISDIIAKILLDASKKRDSVLKNTEIQLQKMQIESESHLKEYEKQYQNETQKILEEHKRKVTLSAEKEAKKIIEKAKYDTSDKVFEDALKQLSSMDGSHFQCIFTDFLQTLPQETNGQIFCPAKRVSVIKETLTQLGLSYGIAVDNTIQDGWIFKAKQFDYNFSFSQIINQAKQDLEIDVVKKLFI
ncbi:hypothetical protein KJ973_02190 [Patescibacteria group bacterium]|nr:hypothetical protein [Patescibacteria group bacterium]MBU1246995.1 hypothetical protein [Patescibacteria group bacterium]MBU1519478.1 hypothetical protein [Patescibacteria group bacterium]MBU1730525.1 hypothetical protein [Patescibacteria group bacterium]MBU1956713.1 hypothetical protein [Patescibacteria group bacterium]